MACRKILMNAGAKKVNCLAIGRTVMIHEHEPNPFDFVDDQRYWEYDDQ